MEDMADDLEVISRETLIVDGRSAILYEHQGSFNGEERYNVVLQTIVGNTVWTNGCSVRPDSRDFDAHLADFRRMVISLEIHE